MQDSSCSKCHLSIIVCNIICNIEEDSTMTSDSNYCLVNRICHDLWLSWPKTKSLPISTSVAKATLKSQLSVCLSEINRPNSFISIEFLGSRSYFFQKYKYRKRITKFIKIMWILGKNDPDHDPLFKLVFLKKIGSWSMIVLPKNSYVCLSLPKYVHHTATSSRLQDTEPKLKAPQSQSQKLTSYVT